MNDSAFLDTNILVYTYSTTELEKRQLSQSLVSNQHVYVSTQVLQELSNILFKKFNKSWEEIQGVLDEVEHNCFVFINTKATIMKACSIAKKYGFSFYDSMIIASALETDCSFLYSEDFSDNQVIEGRLKIINPFGKRI